ncbi:MAG: hypothetical protein LQ340_003546 [Diploschistes diacapsis]|nr:MAG: hypothetical protein LQ340_003546 [Diploschistes diacapsis]
MSSSYVAPGQSRHLRACMVCSVVLHQNKFMRDGCPNCESFLELANHDEAVRECTSQVFEGLITLADPTTSWVARWQRLDKYVPGVYAVKVMGILPDEVLQQMEDSGIRYVPRDGSAEEEDT